MTRAERLDLTRERASRATLYANYERRALALTHVDPATADYLLERAADQLRRIGEIDRALRSK